MTRTSTDESRAGDSTSRLFGGAFDLEELRRRNEVAVGMDVLFLVTVAFFAYMTTVAWGEYHVPVFATTFVIPHPGWPAAIAAVPLVTLLYFGWASSRAFFVAEVLTIGAAVAAAVVGVVPL